MENCKADNIAEKLFRSYWKQGKSSLCKKCYKGLSINSCFVDVNAIKNALLKHPANLFENTYSRCGAGLETGTSPVVSFSKIFSIGNTYFQENLRVFFFTGMCQARIYSLCFYLFLQKIRRPVLFSTS